MPIPADAPDGRFAADPGLDGPLVVVRIEGLDRLCAPSPVPAQQSFSLARAIADILRQPRSNDYANHKNGEYGS